MYEPRCRICHTQHSLLMTPDVLYAWCTDPGCGRRWDGRSAAVWARHHGHDTDHWVEVVRST